MVAEPVAARVRVVLEPPRPPPALGGGVGHLLTFAASGASWWSGLATGALCYALLDVPHRHLVRLACQIYSAVLVACRPAHIVWLTIGWAACALHHSRGQSLPGVVALSVGVEAALLGVSTLQLVFFAAFCAGCVLDRPLAVQTVRGARACLEQALAQRQRLRRLREAPQYDSSSDSE